jgi:2-polyprenyl-3-methyl-5-hydroxy-6-metoxy-1,4-benzoquinol methylase
VPFDPTWEEILKSRPWGRYPAEEVIRFVARRFFAMPNRRQIATLDLGCGGGAHTWFLAREGFTVTAIDGSAAAVEQTRDLLRREKCPADVSVCDFLDLRFPDSSFDAVLDCAAIQHNPWDDILTIHRRVFRMLKPGGWFFGMMLNGDSSEGGERATASGNEIPRFRSGSNPTGVFVHLFSRHELDELFQPYGSVVVDTIDRTEGGGATRLSQYVVTAHKPQ